MIIIKLPLSKNLTCSWSRTERAFQMKIWYRLLNLENEVITILHHLFGIFISTSPKSFRRPPVGDILNLRTTDPQKLSHNADQIFIRIYGRGYLSTSNYAVSHYATLIVFIKLKFSRWFCSTCTLYPRYTEHFGSEESCSVNPKINFPMFLLWLQNELFLETYLL